MLSAEVRLVPPPPRTDAGQLDASVTRDTPDETAVTRANR
jgi:hypothetical protein